MEAIAENNSKSLVKKKVTFSQASKAILDAGYDIVPLKSVEAVATLGQYVEQEAIHTIGAGMMMWSMQSLKNSIDVCDATLKLPIGEITAEEQNSILGRKRQLMEQFINLSKQIQEAAVLVGKTAPQAKVLNPSFGAREQVVPVSGPVQVNIGIRSNGDVSVDGAA